MSLAEGLLLDNLLEGIAATEIFVVLRSDLKDDATRLGAGTADDPYDCSKTAGGVCKFDLVLEEIITNLPPGPKTVRLGPGDIFTDGPSAVTSLPSEMRIVGAGRDVTTIKLNSGSGNGIALGTDDNEIRTGVEISDLCIDVQHNGSAIYFNGVNALVHRLRIVNWNLSTSRAIVQIADSSVGQIARNCVLDDLLFDSPGGSLTGVVTLMKFAGSSKTYSHQFCVARRCFVNAEDASKSYIGIDVGAGRGFIAEENEFHNLQTGIKLENAAAIDLIFWNNEFQIVKYAFNLSHNADSTDAVGRVVVIENAINLARSIAAIAVKISGESTERNFGQLIVRKNLIAADPDGSGGTSSLQGIEVKNVTDALVENNLINDCLDASANPLSFQNCTNFKAFNNQTSAGALLRAYDLGNTKYKMELQDFMEDALIGF